MIMDLVITGGTIVTSGNTFVADIGIKDGKIAQIGGSMSTGTSIDASGKLVIPGGIDVHVHLSPGAMPPLHVDDFYSGTAAALSGGVTTIGSITDAERGEDLSAAVYSKKRVEKPSAILFSTQCLTTRLPLR
jgi:dihydropyrimidinase